MTEEKRDLLGRSWSTVCGWLGKQPIPVGARVRILAGSSMFHKYYAGDEAVIVRSTETVSIWPSEREIRGRMVVPRNEWEDLNHCTLDPELCEIISLGDGQVIGGRDYRFSKLELAEQRFAGMDLTYQDYTNAPTFLAALYLRADSRHSRAVLDMVKANGRINPTRLENYFNKSELQIDEWAGYPEGLPEIYRFRLRVNWPEVAAEFEELAKEQAAYA